VESIRALETWCLKEVQDIAPRLSAARQASAVSVVVASVKRNRGDLKLAHVELEKLFEESLLGGPMSGPAIVQAALELVVRRMRQQRP
jgi:hypothetical protein